MLNAEWHGHFVHRSDRMSVAHSRQNIGAPSEAAHHFRFHPVSAGCN
jgi:hypothetical protein